MEKSSTSKLPIKLFLDFEEKAILSKSLFVGERLIICWLPDRECIIEYLGDYKFKPIECKNSTIKAGDTLNVLNSLRASRQLWLNSISRKMKIFLHQKDIPQESIMVYLLLKDLNEVVCFRGILCNFA